VGWRWSALLVSYYIWTSNAMFFLLVSLLQGPLGLRALFSRQEYYMGKRVNRNTGELEADTSTLCKPMLVRVGALWSTITTERTKFEALPDTGLLGKSFTRVFNMLWYYVVLGLFGSVLLLITFIVGSLVNIVGCTVLFLTTPLWMVAGCVLAMLFHFFLYDYRGDQSTNAALRFLFLRLVWWDILLVGVGSIVTTVVWTALAPVFMLLLCLLGALQFCLHHLYDAFMYCCCVRPRARQPERNSFLSRVVKGPGELRQRFKRVDPQVVMLMLRCLLEREELDVLEEELRQDIDAPLRAYNSMVDGTLSLFLSSPPHLYRPRSQHFSDNQDEAAVGEKQLLQSVARAHGTLDASLRARRNELTKFVATPNWKRGARLTRADMAVLRTDAGRLVRNFYCGRIFPLFAGDQQKLSSFWEKNQLARGDWNGLTRVKLLHLLDSLEPVEEAELHSRY
jgi:hypothetical protein